MKSYWYLALFALFAVFLALGVNAWSRLETLTCDRDDKADKRVRCTVTRETWWTSATTVYPDVVDIRPVDLARGHWGLTIVDRRGDVDDVVEELTEGEAKQFVSSIVARDAHVEVARQRYPLRQTLFIVAMLICLVLVAAGFVLQRRTRQP